MEKVYCTKEKRTGDKYTMKEREYFLRHDYSMKNMNSMNINFTAALVAFPYTEQGVAQVFRDFRDRRIIVVGAGSNSIFVKPYYDEDSVFLVTSWLNEIDFDGEYITAGCGVSLSRLSWYACEKHLTGFEFMEDIPGSIGGGIVMNAGTYSESMKDITYRVRFYNDETKDFEVYIGEHIFRVRDSVFSQKKGMIVSAQFTGKAGVYNDIVRKMCETKKERYFKQPRDYPSAGSVFKKPMVNGVPTNVWKLIREVGLEGRQVGGARVSEKHSGFIINVGGATGEDLQTLCKLCADEVEKKLGVCLTPEWKFID